MSRCNNCNTQNANELIKMKRVAAQGLPPTALIKETFGKLFYKRTRASMLPKIFATCRFKFFFYLV